MKRLCLSSKLNNGLLSFKTSDAESCLTHLRIDDNDCVYAVYSDNSEMDISELFPTAILDDYKDHKILEVC